MAENNSNPPTGTPADSGVPGLIDQYRQQRKAWLAQADELVRLRDEVRSAAEREAMDIVTAARRDVRQVVVEARRELMVLTAQLHAAMEAVDQSMPPSGALRDIETSSVGSEVSSAQSSLGVTRELVLGARREVRGVLDEARAEIEALEAEAPIPFPIQETARVEPEPQRIEKLFFEEAKLAPPLEPPSLEPWDKLISETPEPSSIFSEPSSIFSESDEIEVPEPRQAGRIPFGSSVLHSNDTQLPRTRSAMIVVGLFAVAGVLVTSGAAWWLLSESSSASEPEPAPAAVTAPPTESGARPVASPSVSALGADALSLVIEARRPSWIRASIDGQADAGRLYQAGEKKQIAGAQAVVIRAGDAGAVYVSVNGLQPRPLGADGAVMTRRYAVDEAEVPTASSIGGLSESRAGDNRAASITPASPVTLAVENSTRPTAARADVRAPRSPASPTAPTASNTTSREPAPAGNSLNARPDLVVAGQQWLDAYQRRDRDAMSTAGTDNITVTDERSTTERFPSWQNGVQRELDQVELALTGDTALLTARMTERADGGLATAPPHVSRVSQIWVRRAGQWRLADVRIIAENRLNQIVR